MTREEAVAYNRGVAAVLDIAERTAAAITATSMRRVHEDFAVAALDELAQAGRALLLPVDPEPPSPMPADRQPKPDAPASAAAEVDR